MEKTLHVRSGSSDAIYTLQVICDDGNVTMYCDCNAGAYGKLCKHKLAIIANSKTDMAGQEQEKNFKLAQAWINGSALQSMLAEISAAESEVQSAQTKAKKLKKALEMQLNGQVAKKKVIAE